MRILQVVVIRALVIVAVNPAFTDFGEASFGATVVLEVSIDNLPEPQKSYAKKHVSANGVFWFCYAHLSAISVHIKQFVDAGDQIGKTGHSGNAQFMTTIQKGAHLHFEAWNEANHGGKRSLGGRFDPLPFIVNLT